MHHLDSVDVKLIGLLRQNGRQSIKQLAEQVFMSSPAVTARLARLEKEGVIQGYQPVLDPYRLGYNILAFVSLQVQPGDKPQFSAYIDQMPNVLECSCVTGDYSMLIKVCFKSTMELDAFIGELQRFGKTNTQIVFSQIVNPRAPKL